MAYRRDNISQLQHVSGWDILDWIRSRPRFIFAQFQICIGLDVLEIIIVVNVVSKGKWFASQAHNQASSAASARLGPSRALQVTFVH